MNKSDFVLGELFCGPGGIALGAKLASDALAHYGRIIRHGWANDNDPDTCLTYLNNICPEDPESVICDDVRGIDFSSLSHINSLAFGFPCNDFSVVGEQRGLAGVYGPLYSYGIKALEHFKPDWFLAENVGGLRNSNEGKTLNTILSKMADAGDEGYELTPHFYRFENYGVPQSRHRIIN